MRDSSRQQTSLHSDRQKQARLASNQLNEQTPRVKVALAEQDPITLLGLQTLVGSDANFQICGIYTSRADLVIGLSIKSVDVVLLDSRIFRQKDASLGSFAEAIKIPSVLFSDGLDDAAAVCDAIHAGIKGILPKDIPIELILKCLRIVAAGGEWLERRSMRTAVERFLQQQLELENLTQQLSSREFDIARLVAKGANNKEIAAAVYLSEGSVRVYLTRIYNKLHTSNRTALAMLFKEKGLA